MSKKIRTALIVTFSTVLAMTMAATSATADDLSHGHDCTTASQIPLNGEKTVVLDDNMDFAVYRFALERRGLIDFWTDPGSFSVWGIDLLDAECEPVPGVLYGYSVMTGKYTKITVPTFNIEMPEDSVWTLPPGVYFIRLHPDPVLKAGQPFVLRNKFTAHYGHDCATAEPIPASGSIAGSLLYPEDREVFKFTVNPPSRIRAWLTTPESASPAGLNLDLSLADCSTAIDLEVNDETGRGETTFLEVGTYYLTVDALKWKVPRPFRLELEFVNENNW